MQKSNVSNQRTKLTYKASIVYKCLPLPARARLTTPMFDLQFVKVLTEILKASDHTRRLRVLNENQTRANMNKNKNKDLGSKTVKVIEEMELMDYVARSYVPYFNLEIKSPLIKKTPVSACSNQEYSNLMSLFQCFYLDTLDVTP